MNRERGTRKKKRWLGNTVLALACLLLLPLLLALLALEQLNRTPRALAPYIEHRAAGHNPVIVGIGAWAGQTLRALDRMEPVSYPLPALSAGVQPVSGEISSSAGRRAVEAGTAEQALLAIRQAQPGDDIVLLPGIYRFTGNNIIVSNPGQSGARITVRARQAGTVKLELASQEGFLVSAPFWTFENLHLRGVCATHTDCEHAFHVTGDAQHFIARNNTLLDTGGIEVRYPESSADVTANLVDGKIRAKDGGLLRASDNLDTALISLFLGHHPVRTRFSDPPRFDLTWASKPGPVPRGLAASTSLCGTPRTAQSPAGAFDDVGECLGRPIPAKP